MVAVTLTLLSVIRISFFLDALLNAKKNDEWGFLPVPNATTDEPRNTVVPVHYVTTKDSVMKQPGELLVAEQSQGSSLQRHDQPEIPATQAKDDRTMTHQTLRSDKIIFFLHIHKSAGSGMCALAQLNHLRVQGKENCNVQEDQRCCGNQDSMQAQIDFAQSSPWDFVACEAEMYDSMATDYYHYVVTLRNSRERYFSHWNHVRYHENNTVTETFPEWWARQADNWNTRQLCGSRCKDSSKFGISPELFNYTLQRLELFEDILFVESMTTSFLKFSYKHNWSIPLPRIHNKKEKMKDDIRSLALDWEPMMAALDDALYEFAERKMAGLEPFALFSPQIQSQIDNYFSHGLRRSCSGPCCNVTCSKYR